MESQLSQQAQEVINGYLNLSIGGKNVRCPYFNNRRAGTRAGLRVLIGKGNPEEILEEAKLFMIREKVSADHMSKEQISEYLISHGLGVDCSAFAYYILDAESKSRGLGKLSSHISWKGRPGIIRRLISRLRPAENLGVRTLANNFNSFEVPLNDIQPGDIITVLYNDTEITTDHVFIIDKTIRNSAGILDYISFVHSIAWPKEGTTNHGVRRGTITITNHTNPLSMQRFEEAERTADEYIHYLNRVKNSLSIRRLNWFAK